MRHPHPHPAPRPATAGRHRRAVAALALTAALAVPLAAQAAQATTGPAPADSSTAPRTGTSGVLGAAPPAPCTAAQRQAAFAADRARVLGWLGNSTTIDNWPELIELGTKGWTGLVHGFMSQQGLGVTIIRPKSPMSATNVLIPVAGTPAALPGNMPDALWYAPDPKATNPADPHNPSFPYHLAGWSYSADYNFAQHPVDRGPACLTRDNWLVHERGIHDAATLGFIPEPPAEEFKGQDPGNAPIDSWELFQHPGVTHNRLWMTDLWLGANGNVASSFADPYESIQGVDPHYGSWYFKPPAALILPATGAVRI